MAYFVIVVVSTVVLGFIVAKYDADDRTEWVMFGFMGAVLGALLGGVVALLVSVFVSDLPTKEVKTNTTEVYALQDGDSVSGSFFFGTGYVDGDMLYTFMAKEGAGLRMQQVSAEKALLVEDSTPRIETYESRFVNSYVRYWFGSSPITSEKGYVIYAPSGTVKQSFSVDLQ